MNSFADIQAVTFDAGGTLIEPWPSVGHVYAEVAKRFGVEGITVETLNQGFAAAWRAKLDFDYSQAAWFELVRQTFGEHAPSLPDDFFPALYERFAEPDTWRVYDDVLPALETLAARRLRLGVISNWDERLHVLLERLNLRVFFECVIVSRDVGFTKPSPQIFEIVLRKLGQPAECVLHVGDSLTEDVEGAKKVGFQALHLNRAGGGEIFSLREITQMLP